MYHLYAYQAARAVVAPQIRLAAPTVDQFVDTQYASDWNCMQRCGVVLNIALSGA